MLSEATIKELQQILKKEYGQEISITEVSEIAYTLTNYFSLLAKIYHQKNIENQSNIKNK